MGFTFTVHPVRRPTNASHTNTFARLLSHSNSLTCSHHFHSTFASLDREHEAIATRGEAIALKRMRVLLPFLHTFYFLTSPHSLNTLHLRSSSTHNPPLSFFLFHFFFSLYSPIKLHMQGYPILSFPRLFVLDLPCFRSFLPSCLRSRIPECSATLRQHASVTTSSI